MERVLDPESLAEHPVLLFDGDCSVCSWSVHFVIRRDSEGVFRFAALQSEVGGRIAAQYGLDASVLDTLILVDARGAHTYSTGVLRTAWRLGWPWRLAAVFLAVPRFIRDAVYRWFAARRYRFLPQADTCLSPIGPLRERFLDL